MPKIFAEKALIARLRRLAQAAHTAVRTGIGDDCAVLHLGKRGLDKRARSSRGKAAETLVTTDFSLEGIHFRRDWHSPESVGHRCLARGLSDIAAMGGNPWPPFSRWRFPAI